MGSLLVNGAAGDEGLVEEIIPNQDIIEFLVEIAAGI